MFKVNRKLPRPVSKPTNQLKNFLGEEKVLKSHLEVINRRKLKTSYDA